MTVEAHRDKGCASLFSASLARSQPNPRSVALVEAVCAMAGSMTLIADIEAELAAEGVLEAMAAGQTGPTFDWLLTQFSFQGVSDQAARTFMARNGTATWAQIEKDFERQPSCPKLRSYWHFAECGYNKTRRSCAEPGHIAHCPVPQFDLRNGRLNVLAYSFYLFVRDIADGDLIGWIDNRLNSVALDTAQDANAARQAALIGPLRNIFGISDKLLGMTISNLLIGAGRTRPLWLATGISMLAVDSLVHAFLHRTGILHACGRPHAYGPACYAKDGCANIIRTISKRIDARTFNSNYPAVFPRFIQFAIWRYCAADGLNICNGNRIDDRHGCRDHYCRLGPTCCRKRLKI